MKFYRIKAIVLKNIYNEFSNIVRLADSLYWPVIDIALWGLSSVWLQKTQPGVPNIVLTILTGLVFWQVINRANNEISLTMIEEVWSKSLVNLFSTPLQLFEWLCGALITGLIKTTFVVWTFYALNIFTAGWILIPFSFSLILYGWTIGLIGASLIIYWGQKMSSVPWMMLFLFAPFSAVFYPLDVLPYWMRIIAKSLPGAYIFEGMRKSLFNPDYLPLSDLLISYGLNIIYLTLAVILFKFMFEKSRSKGLAQL
jgi:ABC-2 type transport system permease protein